MSVMRGVVSGAYLNVSRMHFPHFTCNCREFLPWNKLKHFKFVYYHMRPGSLLFKVFSYILGIKIYYIEHSQILLCKRMFPDKNNIKQPMLVKFLVYIYVSNISCVFQLILFKIFIRTWGGVVSGFIMQTNSKMNGYFWINKKYMPQKHIWLTVIMCIIKYHTWNIQYR